MPLRFRRKSIRLKGFNYADDGVYFVTICTENREPLFGSIENERMALNEYGRMVEQEWLRTPLIRPNVVLDMFVIMPNHMHAILMIDNDYANGRGGTAGICRGVLQYAPTSEFRSPSQTVGAIIRGFKSSTTANINRIRRAPGTRVWQRNYYEHIVRSHEERCRIQRYILDNPALWHRDRNNV